MATPEPWLTTERLALRRLTDRDLAWLVALHGNAEVMRHLGGAQSPSAVQAFMKTRVLDYYAERPGLGIWMTLDRSTGLPVGLHLLNTIQGESLVQVGFILLRHAWGMGYATEMAVALLRHGFVDLELPMITGMAAPENVASQRVLEKIGLRRHGERSFPHPAYASAGPQAWFEREASEWLAERDTE
jgi:[ribosomal protein S5]-alanine N-acetyltransferase